VEPAQAAEEHEVRMLNRGEAGIMVFEPAYLKIAPGDTVHFRAADRGHNAAAIDGMVPPGGESWSGQLNQDVSVTFTAEGVRSDRAADRRAQSRSVDHCGRCQLGPNCVCKDGPVFPWSKVGRLILMGEG
jgi:hypothetical protein